MLEGRRRLTNLLQRLHIIVRSVYEAHRGLELDLESDSGCNLSGMQGGCLGKGLSTWTCGRVDWRGRN